MLAEGTGWDVICPPCAFHVIRAVPQRWQLLLARSSSLGKVSGESGYTPREKKSAREGGEGGAHYIHMRSRMSKEKRGYIRIYCPQSEGVAGKSALLLEMWGNRVNGSSSSSIRASSSSIRASSSSRSSSDGCGRGNSKATRLRASTLSPLPVSVHHGFL